jgi:hypothetical protein
MDVGTRSDAVTHTHTHTHTQFINARRLNRKGNVISDVNILADPCGLVFSE